jgi:Bromodomain
MHYNIQCVSAADCRTLLSHHFRPVRVSFYFLLILPTNFPCLLLNLLSIYLSLTFFLYPYPLTPRSLFPEYYEIIKNPIDLTAIKEQINKYETVEECLGDIRQVWENCRMFNAEGSEIFDTADSLHAELEEMVEVRVCVCVCVCVCVFV